jgi:pimeloyl-ACP methyl ester carboxylesterase
MCQARTPIEMARIETTDGLFLDGVLWHPQSTGQLPVDAFLLIHGTGSNFYAPGLLETFARLAVAGGTAVLRINTRGHDGISSIPGRSSSLKGGATYERIGDCTLDVTASVSWLAAKGFDRVVLVGHSMGGVKALYSQAHAHHAAVTGVIGISPPRFSHQRMASHPRGEKFREEFGRARDLVAQGQPEQLLAVTQPLPFLATAAGYVEKYGPEDRYDFVPLLLRLKCPVLILFGSESIKTSPAFDGLDTALTEVVAGNSAIACEIVAGANINYTGCENVPFTRAAAWLASPQRAAGLIPAVSG